MKSHRTAKPAPGLRSLAAILAGVTLVALILSYLGGAVAAAAPTAQEATPTASATDEPGAEPGATPEAGEPTDELPPAARAALEAYVNATGAENGLAAASDQLPVDVANDFTYLHLPQLFLGREIGQAPETPTPTTPPTEEPTEEPEPETANVAVTLWSDPSIRVIRGGEFFYDIRLKNYGVGAAREVQVTLPYRRDQYSLIEARLHNNAGDWVSNITNNSITITFGRLAPGAERAGRLRLRAASNLPTDTIIDLRADYGWRDNGDGATGRRSNWAPLLIGAGNAHAPWVWTAISPTSGPAWTIFRAQSNRFAPGETVVTWLNMPGGQVRGLELRGTADALGAVTLNFQDSRLAPGNYQIVLYGQRSGLTGVAGFTVTR